MAETVGVVGGGIVGLAVARELTRRRPDDRVVVIEKEDRVGAHQTGHNSGVVHAGIYYAPGTLKARLCTRGRKLLQEYCSENALPFEQCGKLVVAIDPAELGGLAELETRARRNGVPSLQRLDGEQLREVEPYAAGLAALHSPVTARTNFAAIASRLAAEVGVSGEVLLSAEVKRIVRRGARLEVVLADGGERVLVDRLVLCPGLHADRLGRLVGGRTEPRILPFRGEYLDVAPAKRDLVRGMIYPVPDPRYPFLGVHFTRRIDGGLEVGPNAVLALAREGYRRTDIAVADLVGIATWPGTWRFVRRHWRTGVNEALVSISTSRYMATASRYVPAIASGDVTRGRAGVRAQAVNRDGTLMDDFRIEHAHGVTTVRNAPSPAATSSLAIAEYVVDALNSL